METSGLRRVYDALLAEVVAGEFGPPPPDGLSAEQIVAHLAANDELMSQASEAVLAGSTYAYYDLGDIHRPQLDAMVAQYGGLAGLTTLFRESSRRLCALADQLGAATQTPVETHLREGIELTVDEALPWGRTLDLHARVHLPMHLAHLRALRAAR